MYDTKLVLAAQHGDDAAFAALYDRNADAVYDLCLALVGEQEEASRLTILVFTLAARHLTDISDASQVRPWLLAITRDRVLAEEEAGTLRSAWGIPASGATEAVSAEPLGTGDLRRWARDAAATLALADQVVVELCTRYDLDPDQLAAAIGCTPERLESIIGQVGQEAEQVIGSLILARQGRKDCRRLAALLPEWDGRPTVEVADIADRHAASCERCRRRRAMVSPLELLAATPSIAPPPGLRASVLDHAFPELPDPGAPTPRSPGGLGAALAVGGAGALALAGAPAAGAPAAGAPAAGAPAGGAPAGGAPAVGGSVAGAPRGTEAGLVGAGIAGSAVGAELGGPVGADAGAAAPPGSRAADADAPGAGGAGGAAGATAAGAAATAGVAGGATVAMPVVAGGAVRREAVTVTPPPPPRRPWGLIAAVGAAIIALVVAIVLLLQPAGNTTKVASNTTGTTVAVAPGTTTAPTAPAAPATIPPIATTTIASTLPAAAGSQLSLNTSGIDFGAYATSAQIVLTDSGAVQTGWHAASPASWLTISPPSGFLQSSGQVQVTFLINRQKAPNGPFDLHVTFMPSDAAGTSASLSVSGTNTEPATTTTPPPSTTTAGGGPEVTHVSASPSTIDAAPCASDQSVISATVTDPVAVSSVVIDYTLPGGAPGSATMAASGASGGSSSTWSGSINASAIAGKITYTVTATDANGHVGTSPSQSITVRACSL